MGYDLDKLVFHKNTNIVFIFIVNLSTYVNNISKCFDYLSVEEQIQANNYYTKSLRDQYITSHGILRRILSNYTKQSPVNVEFTYNEYGKPFLKDSNIQFNMSHSHDMVGFAIALDCRVGIDIELHNDNLDVQELNDLVLTSTESQYLSNFKSQEKLKLFYHLWTKKEALVKATGQGLSYPMNTIEAIDLSSGQGIFLANETDGLQQEWYCYELQTPRNYSSSIAIDRKIDKIIYLDVNNK